MKLDIPDELIKSIDDYLARDWKSTDPSKFGALNAVAYIGERMVATLAAARRMPPTEAETNLEKTRKAHRQAAHVYAGVKKGPDNHTRRAAAASQLERSAIAVVMALAIAREEA